MKQDPNKSPTERPMRLIRRWRAFLSFCVSVGLLGYPRGLLQASAFLLNPAYGRPSFCRSVGEQRYSSPVPLSAETSLEHVQACVDAGEAAKALRALEGAQDQGLVPPTGLYNAVLSCCAEQGDWELALQAIKSMVLSAGHAPSSETYLAGIRGCIKSGNQLGGLHIYEAMISARVSPDAETLETVLEGLPEGVDGWTLLEQARLGFNLQPSKVMYCAIIRHILHRKPPSSGEVGKEEEKHQPRGSGSPSLSRAVSELSKHRLDELALTCLLEEAFKLRRVASRAVKPLVDLFLRDADASFDEQTYALAISLCKHFNSLEQGLRVLHASEKFGKASVIGYNMVMKTAERSKQPRKALGLLRDLKETDGLEPDVVSYNTAMSACAKAGLPDEALRLLAEMDDEPHLSPNLRAYNSVIDSLGQAGRWKDAIEYMTILTRKGFKADLQTFVSLIKACSRGGQAVKALTFLDSMKLVDVPPDAVAYSAAVEACARGGLHDKALAIFEELKQAGYRPLPQVYRALIQAGCLSLQQVSEMLPLLAPHERNNYVLSAAIRACERESDWKMALRFYDDMTKGGLQPDDLTITQLLRVLAHTARWQEALALLNTTKRRNVRHFTAAIQACASAGRAEDALALYEEMRTRRVTPDTVTFNGLLQACRSQGLAPTALALYRSMVGQYSLKPDIVTYTLLIGTLEKAGAASTGAAARGWQEESVRLWKEGVGQGVLLKSYLDNVYEKDLSKLSFQLIRPAVVHTLHMLQQHYALHGTADAEDLVLITGVDTGSTGQKAAPEEQGKQAAKRPPETRSELARAVLRSQGLIAQGKGEGLQVQGDAGIVRVAKEPLLHWLEEEQASAAEAQRRQNIR